MNNAKEFFDLVKYKKSISNISDIKSFLKKGYLIICYVNYNTMANKSGYIGHFVLIKGFDDNHLIIHDPGLPAIRNRLVSFDLFEKSWAFPDKQAKNIIAIRL